MQGEGERNDVEDEVDKEEGQDEDKYILYLTHP